MLAKSVVSLNAGAVSLDQYNCRSHLCRCGYPARIVRILHLKCVTVVRAKVPTISHQSARGRALSLHSLLHASKHAPYTGSKRTIVVNRRISASVNWSPLRYLRPSLRLFSTRSSPCERECMHNFVVSQLSYVCCTLWSHEVHAP